MRIFSRLLIRGGRVLDIPSCKYRIIHQPLGRISDLYPSPDQKKSRSKYAIKNEDFVYQKRYRFIFKLKNFILNLHFLLKEKKYRILKIFKKDYFGHLKFVINTKRIRSKQMHKFRHKYRMRQK